MKENDMISQLLRNQFITSQREEREGNVHVFQKTISLTKRPHRARLWATALGVYEFELDGKKVGDIMFAPGYTYYPYRLLYQEYDITSLLHIGENTLDTYLGQGWYCGRFTCHDKYQMYGNRPAISWRMELEYEDGQCESIVSDEDVLEVPSPYAYASLYNGEEFYADGLDGETIAAIKFGGTIPDELLPSEISVKIQEEMPVQQVIKQDDKTILDFGQNFAGIICIHSDKLSGATLTIRHGEILNQDGTLYTENLRKAKATTIYHAGINKNSYRPRFTYMGFRYAEISGTPYQEGLITAYAIYSDMKRTGHFSSGNALVEKLYENQVWGQKSNYVAVPTDCPQRDEREGYTGDGQVFAKTGSYNFDTRSFWRQYLADLASGQQDNTEGFVGGTVPARGVEGIGKINMLGWGNAVTILPDFLYEHYGEIDFLKNQYHSMKLFVEAEIRQMNHSGLWIGMNLGDWLTYGKGMGYLILRNNPISNAFVVHDLDLMKKAARLLGYEEDAIRYGTLAEHSRKGYIKRWVKNNGTIAGGYQAAAIMALAYVIPDGTLREKALKKLCHHVRKNGMQTGFFATQHILQLLVEAGEPELAYDVLLNEACPGWMYQVKAGATTTWERWDALRPDGTINESKVGVGNMVSFNHYAFGSVGEFYYENILGIRAIDPGFKKIRIAPVTDKRLGYVKGSYKTPHGTVRIEWEYKNDIIHFEIETPVDTEMILVGKTYTVGPGRYSF